MTILKSNFLIGGRVASSIAAPGPQSNLTIQHTQITSSLSLVGGMHKSSLAVIGARILSNVVLDAGQAELEGAAQATQQAAIARTAANDASASAEAANSALVAVGPLAEAAADSAAAAAESATAAAAARDAIAEQSAGTDASARAAAAAATQAAGIEANVAATAAQAAADAAAAAQAAAQAAEHKGHAEAARAEAGEQADRATGQAERAEAAADGIYAAQVASEAAQAAAEGAQAAAESARNESAAQAQAAAIAAAGAGESEGAALDALDAATAQAQDAAASAAASGAARDASKAAQVAAEGARDDARAAQADSEAAQVEAEAVRDDAAQLAANAAESAAAADGTKAAVFEARDDAAKQAQDAAASVRAAAAIKAAADAAQAAAEVARDESTKQAQTAAALATAAGESEAAATAARDAARSAKAAAERAQARSEAAQAASEAAQVQAEAARDSAREQAAAADAAAAAADATKTAVFAARDESAKQAKAAATSAAAANESGVAAEAAHADAIRQAEAASLAAADAAASAIASERARTASQAAQLAAEAATRAASEAQAAAQAARDEAAAESDLAAASAAGADVAEAAALAARDAARVARDASEAAEVAAEAARDEAIRQTRIATTAAAAAAASEAAAHGYSVTARDHAESLVNANAVAKAAAAAADESEAAALAYRNTSQEQAQIATAAAAAGKNAQAASEAARDESTAQAQAAAASEAAAKSARDAAAARAGESAASADSAADSEAVAIAARDASRQQAERSASSAAAAADSAAAAYGLHQEYAQQAQGAADSASAADASEAAAQAAMMEATRQATAAAASAATATDQSNVSGKQATASAASAASADAARAAAAKQADNSAASAQQSDASRAAAAASATAAARSADAAEATRTAAQAQTDAAAAAAAASASASEASRVSADAAASRSEASARAAADSAAGSATSSASARDFATAAASARDAAGDKATSAAASATAAATSRDASAASADAAAQSAKNAADSYVASQPVSARDASNGYPGLSGFKLNLKNALGTFISYLTNNNTSERTYTLPNKSGTVALTSDITGTNSGTNTGDETGDTIKAKLGKATAAAAGWLDSVDWARFEAKQVALGYVPIDSARIGVAGGVVPLGADSKIAAVYLPSFVDDVVEASSYAALPATGEAGKIYVALDTNNTYRWGGSAYVEISASPGSTDAVPEGATNMYHTGNRVRATLISGLSVATNAAITAADTVLSAFGKLQKQITDLTASVATKASLAGANFTGIITSTGNLNAGTGSNGETSIQGGLNGAIELGLKGRTAAGTPFIDFHSALNSGDYDVRLIASGGDTTGATSGQGTLDIRAASFTHGGWTVLTSANYFNYSPKLDGSGAVGTWGIGITGNAGTATKLATARAINGVAFDGSANITVTDSTKLPLSGGTLTDALTINVPAAMTDPAVPLPTVLQRLSVPNAGNGGRGRLVIENTGARGDDTQTGRIFIDAYRNNSNTDLVIGTANGGAPTDALVVRGSGNIEATRGMIVAPGASGFASTTYAVNARNPIWRFANSDSYGLSYFQGTAGMSTGSSYLDAIGLHFGAVTAAGSQYTFRSDGWAVFSGRLTTFGATMSNGGDLIFNPTSAGDAGDIVWMKTNGTESHRLWSDAGISSLNFRFNGGPTYYLWHSGNLNPQVSAVANSTVLRDGNGYITGNYIYMTDEGVNGSDAYNDVTGIITKKGDHYYRNTGAGAVKKFLGIAGLALRSIAASENLNSFYAHPGTYRVQSTPANCPTPDGNLLVMAQSSGSDTTGQIYVPYNASDIYVRAARGYGSTWTTWARVLTEANPSVWRSYVSRVADDGVILESFNTTASTQPRQFYLAHTLGNVIMGNDRGNLRVQGVAQRLARNGNTNDGMTFNWVGQPGQPAWLWGGSDGSDMYVYNPSGFSVAYAGSAGNTNSVSSATGGAYTWTGYQTFVKNGGAQSTHVNYAGTIVGTTFCSTDGGAAGFSFLRNGIWGVNMSLDYDNVIRIGGWSAAGNLHQFDMSGNYTASGNITAYSDERKKTNWRNIAPGFVAAWANVKSGIYDRIDTGETQVGLSAQAVQNLLPDAIQTDAEGFLSLNYGAAAAVATIELAKEVVVLRRELAELKNLMKKVSL